MKIRNKKTGEIKEVSINELNQYGLGGQHNKLIKYQNKGEVKKDKIKQAFVTAYNNYNNRVFPAETLPIRQKAFKTINPSDYTDLRNYGRWVANEQRDQFYDPRSEEAFKFYLGLSKPEELQYLKKSKYKPTINATDQNYYSVDSDLEQDIFNSFKDKLKLNEILQTSEAEFETPLSGKDGAGLLGRFGVSRGHDENGDYLSYYDKYDLKDFAQSRTKGIPYSIYNRIYYPKKQTGGEMIDYKSGGQHGGLDRWFAEKWVDIKTGEPCGRQEGENRNYPACRPSKRISSDTPKTASELSSAERQKFKQEKTSSQRISYNHNRKEYGGENIDNMNYLNYMKSGGNVPTNPELYSRVKSEAKSKFNSWPSAYGSAWLVKTYKSRGGGYRKAEYGMEVMGNGGVPTNSGFVALPEYVQQNIINNMATGGQKMPPQLAYARFAAAGNLNQLGRYGYKDGGEEEVNNLKNVNLNLPVYRKPEINPLNFNKFLVNDRNQNLFIGGINPRYQNENFSVGPYMIGVGNKYFQKFPADMGMSGTYHVNDNFDINMGVGQNNVNAGIKYKFNNGGDVDMYGMQYQDGGDIPTIEGPSGYMNEDNVWVVDNETITKQAQELGAKKVLTEGGSLIIFDDDWNIVAADDNPDAPYKQGGSVTLNAGGENHRIYVKTTNRGEGEKGHIMVNHPTMDKGMWDTIDLTKKSGATTIAQGVAATKKWHRENPYMKEYGGDVPMYANGGGIPERYRNMGFTNVGTKKQSTRPGKKWMVLAKKGDDYKVVHGGYKGMQDFKQHHSEQRKENFWSRMGGRNSSKATDPFSPLYWHKRFGTWEQGGEIPKAQNGLVVKKYIQQTPYVNNFTNTMPSFENFVIDQKPVIDNAYVYQNNRQANTYSKPSNVTKNKSNKYNDIYEKTKKYLARDVFAGAPLKANDIANAIEKFKVKTGYDYPLDLLLAQAQQETHFGKELKSKHNYFNVGNDDDGNVINFASPEESFLNYMDLVYNDYLQKGKKDYNDLLVDKAYVNYAGKRYAKDPLYEKKLKGQSEFINKFLNKKKKGGQYMAVGGQNVMNPIVKKDNRNWLEYLKN